MLNGRSTARGSRAAAQAGVRTGESEERQQVYEMGRGKSWTTARACQSLRFFPTDLHENRAAT